MRGGWEGGRVLRGDTSGPLWALCRASSSGDG